MIVPGRETRRGVTLIEMMAVLSALAVLLGLCAVTIQLLLRLGTDAQTRRASATALARLAEQFRADVHAYEDAEVKPSEGLRLKGDPGVVIEYQVRGGRVARVETTGGGSSRHESYELGRHDTAAFERRDDGPRRFVALVVRRKERAGPTEPTHTMEVLALVGKDRTGAPRSGGGPPR